MIYWEVLLGTEDVCGTLDRLYQEFKGSGPLAAHLGVSAITLRKKLKECKISMLPRGGAHIKFSRENLPANWWNFSTEHLVRLTGYTSHYVRRLKREQLCQLAQSTKTQEQAGTSATSQENLLSEELDKESSK